MSSTLTKRKPAAKPSPTKQKTTKRGANRAAVRARSRSGGIRGRTDHRSTADGHGAGHDDRAQRPGGAPGTANLGARKIDDMRGLGRRHVSGVKNIARAVFIAEKGCCNKNHFSSLIVPCAGRRRAISGRLVRDRIPWGHARSSRCGRCHPLESAG